MKQCHISIGYEHGHGKLHSLIVNELATDDKWDVARRMTDLADILYNQWAAKRGFTLSHFKAKNYHSESEARYQFLNKRINNYSCEVRDIIVSIEVVSNVVITSFGMWNVNSGFYRMYLIPLACI